uniref:Protein kinase domain-containing protein n=1 Tax=Timema cristinae TaxID=61476 RepID=A0A7R9CK93_TIMCR|nr:unnamed protein product [Timema cristinae]
MTGRSRGLFANVLRCRSRETGQQFAAKFSSRARYGEDCSAEIYHEIALLSLCAPSPRIVGLHDVFETPSEIIIVMEFAPGGDLQTIIDDNLVPFESDVVKFVRQLVEGLVYLHERKIAHLDIKMVWAALTSPRAECMPSYRWVENYSSSSSSSSSSVPTIGHA